MFPLGGSVHSPSAGDAPCPARGHAANRISSLVDSGKPLRELVAKYVRESRLCSLVSLSFFLSFFLVPYPTVFASLPLSPFPRLFRPRGPHPCPHPSRVIFRVARVALIGTLLLRTPFSSRPALSGAFIASFLTFGLSVRLAPHVSRCAGRGKSLSILVRSGNRNRKPEPATV
jgi:hypothetical protein